MELKPRCCSKKGVKSPIGESERASLIVSDALNVYLILGISFQSKNLWDDPQRQSLLQYRFELEL